jgi:hypothetical protein
MPARTKLSKPIWISVIRLIPTAVQAARSLGIMRLEAVAISGDSAPPPLQNNLKPSPVLLELILGVLNGPDLAKW